MSNLREELDRKRREQPAPTVCVQTTAALGVPSNGNAAAFLGFWPTPLEHVGFCTGQLLRFKLVTRKPDLADDPTRPPQTLTLSFPTDDVVITGKYLDEICRLLAKNELATVTALPERHGELDPLKTFVTKIEIIPVTKA